MNITSFVYREIPQASLKVTALQERKKKDQTMQIT